jgi:predicted GIY-YIG superfamily endonuclease
MVKFEWTLELCKQESIKYTRKIDFLKSCGQAYRIAHKKGWLNEICSHMVEGRKPNRYWNKENCAKEASKYKHKKDFQENNPSAYVVAHRSGWLEEICSHMIPLGNIQKRYIYKAIFYDDCVYIGLTCNPEKRFNSHLSDEKSSVYKHMLETNSKPVFELISDTLYSKEDASELEDLIVEEYKKLGKCILNKNKAGGLGGGKIKWTFEICRLEALKYTTKKEFILNNENAYNACLKNKWIGLVCSHMVELKKLNNYWTKERCHEKALKYSLRSQFIKEANSIYSKAFAKGWAEEICSHMIDTRKSRNYWNYENCKTEAKKYTNRFKFKIGSSGAFGWARKNNWLEDFFPK